MKCSLALLELTEAAWIMSGEEHVQKVCDSLWRVKIVGHGCEGGDVVCN